jgi:protein-tyrosine-phosphatase
MNYEPSESYSICVVCTGNTCRSPITEGLLKAVARDSGHGSWEVSSGGLYARNGAVASAFGVDAAREHGVDISGHRASLFDRARAESCDLILLHSGEHMMEISDWGESIVNKSYLLKHFPTHGDPGPVAWVDDPVGQNLDRYRATFLELDEVVRRIVPHIRDRAKKGAS